MCGWCASPPRGQLSGGLGVSCSADRQMLAKITPEGLFLEALETDPARYMPDVKTEKLSSDVVSVDLNQPMEQIRATLSQYPIKTRVNLIGPCGGTGYCPCQD